jgi:hypothetical protein
LANFNRKHSKLGLRLESSLSFGQGAKHENQNRKGQVWKCAHKIYDINDGLVDIILEVTPTTEQQAEGLKEREDR